MTETPTQAPEPKAPDAKAPSYREWAIILILLAIASLALLRLQPGGFPLLHPRHLANRLTPAAALALAIFGLRAIFKNNSAQLRFAALLLSGTSLGFFASTMVCFPISAARLGIPGSLVALLLLARTIANTGPRKIWRPWHGLVVLLALAFGCALPLTQRAPDADTRPRNLELPALEAPQTTRPNSEALSLKNKARISVTGRVSWSIGDLQLEITPQLLFYQRSPDRFWINLAPKRYRNSPPPVLAEWSSRPGHIDARFETRDESNVSHQLRLAELEDALLIESFSELPAPIYSHVNSFLILEMRGIQAPGLSFENIPDHRFEMEFADYPVGRPLSFAALYPDEQLRVLRAKSGEKGPFIERAAGHLARGASLTMTIFNGAEPRFTLQLEDWTQQLSTSLSPTAGWGVPLNVVSFRKSGLDEAQLWISLADTGIGRGFDSTGHSPGIYRNRILITPIRS